MKPATKTLLKKVVVTLNEEEFAFDDCTPTEMVVYVNEVKIPLTLNSEEYFKVQGDLNCPEGDGSYKTADAKSADLMSVVSDSLRDNFDFYSSDKDGFEFLIINCNNTVIATTSDDGVFIGWSELSALNDASKDNSHETSDMQVETKVATNSIENTKKVTIFVDINNSEQDAIISVVVDELPIAFVPDEQELKYVLFDRHNKFRSEWATLFTATRLVKRVLDERFPEEFQPEGEFDRFQIDLLTKKFVLKNSKVAVNTDDKGFITEVFEDDADSNCSLSEWYSAEERKQIFNMNAHELAIQNEFYRKEQSLVSGC